MIISYFAVLTYYNYTHNCNKKYLELLFKNYSKTSFVLPFLGTVFGHTKYNTVAKQSLLLYSESSPGYLLCFL